MPSPDIAFKPDLNLTPDAILIFEKPEAYFFPHYQGRVFAPFGVPRPSLGYLAYKVLHLLHLPGAHLFWGAWKIPARTARQVVIFDYGYQRGMERYIRRINPDCQVTLFFWNKINPYNKGHLRFSDPDAVFSTDPEDCAKYGLKYNHIFYPREYYTPATDSPVTNSPVTDSLVTNSPATNSLVTDSPVTNSSVTDSPVTCPHLPHRLFFLGADKGRAPYIASLKHVLEEGGLICDIRVITSTKDPSYRERYQEILTHTGLSYDEYLTQLESCDVLLDVNQEGQAALTMRVMEAVYLSKKLITGNRHILTYDFYDPDNIFILPEKGLPAPEEIRRFLHTPFRPYPDAVLEHYSFEHWLQAFT